MILDYQNILGVIASLLAIAATIPYIRGIYRGTNKPHLFAWIIWALLTVIAFLGQMAGGGGAGAWNTGVASLMCVWIVTMTWSRVAFTATRLDWWMFGVGMASIPLWLVTSNPLWAIIIVTAVEGVAFALTFKKAWFKPHEEVAILYILNLVRHVVALIALTQFNLVTALFPSVMLLLNLGLISMLALRRRTVNAG
ncbi:MAG TPA: hypothetical protein VIN59_06275 [Alphaproteobacteria bacterium]